MEQKLLDEFNFASSLFTCFFFVCGVFLLFIGLLPLRRQDKKIEPSFTIFCLSFITFICCFLYLTSCSVSWNLQKEWKKSAYTCIYVVHMFYVFVLFHFIWCTFPSLLCIVVRFTNNIEQKRNRDNFGFVFWELKMSFWWWFCCCYCCCYFEVV